MKCIYGVFLLLILFSLCSTKPKDEITFSSIFDQDSGYIDKQQLLFLFPKIDTTDFVEESELYGKYFKISGTSQYIALVYKPNRDGEEYSATQVVKVDVAKEEIAEGDSILYWWFYSVEDQIKNFSKIDGYYYLPLCIGHGSGFGAYGFYLFNKIDETANPIYESIYSGFSIPGYTTLSMEKLKIVNDTLKINYLIESGVFEEIDGRDTTRTTSVEEWNIDYIKRNKEWAALDSTLFKTAENIFL